MVVPKDTQFDITVSKEFLHNSLRRVALFSDIKGKGVRFNFNENELQIYATTPEYGEAKDEIAVEFDKEPLTIGFNVTYVQDILKCIDSENMIIRINNPSGPVVFQPAVQTDFNYLTVVMPMII